MSFEFKVPINGMFCPPLFMLKPPQDGNGSKITLQWSPRSEEPRNRLQHINANQVLKYALILLPCNFDVVITAFL